MRIRALLLPLLLLVTAPAFAAGDEGWFYRGSDIARDPAWRFGTLPNGLRYAVRRNPLPKDQVAIRVRIDAGSLHEADAERGWMHFIEHLAFRGTESFADREARETWQRLGASFGSDSNASTSPTQTVYQLDLPKNDEASLDQSLRLIAEMVDSARFDPATVEAEKKVVLAEKGRRPELAVRYQEVSWPLLYRGLRIADRDTIGTDATLGAATSAGLRALYERWYRPDRATVVLVGDADPDLLERLVQRHFAAWQPEGPAVPEPDHGRPADVRDRVAALAYPGAPRNASVNWIRPYEPELPTMAREEQDFAETLAQRIINRRLEARARGDAAYVAAGLVQQRNRNIADTTMLNVSARNGNWQAALADAYAILADALASPPSKAEIDRELREIRISASASVESDPTIRSPQRAGQLVNALDSNDVVTTPAAALALVDRFAPRMTPERVASATKRLFVGKGPRLVLLAPEPVAPAALDQALAAAEKAAPAQRQADREVSFAALPTLGPPGKEVAREQIADLGVTIVRFDNGSSLVFKQTEFEKGSVQVQLRFGGGLAAVGPRDVPLWAAGVIGPSGLADLDLDGMERLLTGRRMGLAFGTEEDAFVLRALTNGTDLADQLRLLATKLHYPRWDGPLYARTQTRILEGYDLSFASATARAGRESAGFLRGGDPRYLPAEKAEISDTPLDAVRALFDPLLAAGPIEGVIVGDVDLETAVAAFARSVGALPRRAPPPSPAGSLAVRPPTPDPTPRTFTHKGDPTQAWALIGWTTFGGTDNIKARRALSVAANIVQVRLFDRLREAEGASYSPGAGLNFSEVFPDWGVFQASAEVRPESVPTFFRIAREVVADMATKPVAADEFERAQNPIISGIARTLRTNAYWLNALEGFSADPSRADPVRSYAGDYAGMTPEDVRAAMERFVADAGDWSLVVLPERKAGS